MCYAIPGKVVEIKENKVTVDYFGEIKYARNEFVSLSLGDYIYAQGGFVIQKISPEDAYEILETWKELFFELKKIDVRLSAVSETDKEVPKDFLKIIDKAAEGRSLSDKELLRLLKTASNKELNLLYRTANFIRQKYVKNSACVHGIIEFSNHCRNNCLYCGLRRDNQNLQRYRLPPEEIIETVDKAVNQLGFKALVLQSGEDHEYRDEILVEIVKKIKERCAVLLFLSIGERGYDTYKKLYEAGARGVLLRFETSNPELHAKLRPGVKPFGRIEHLKFLHDLGYLIISGGLIGLPDQTEEDLAQDIKLAKELKAEMYSFGPYLPHPSTPLKDCSTPKLDIALKVIAAIRLYAPEAKILVTTALETLDKEKGARMGLLAGAGSMMINLTPEKYRKLYEIYPNKIQSSIQEVLDLLYSLGRAPTDFSLS